MSELDIVWKCKRCGPKIRNEVYAVQRPTNKRRPSDKTFTEYSCKTCRSNMAKKARKDPIKGEKIRAYDRQRRNLKITKTTPP